MNWFPLLCILLWSPCTIASMAPRGGEGGSTSRIVPHRNPRTTILVSKSRFERYIDKVFANADSNKDGKINFSEVYELVLKIYVQLNRQAPVPPPSRESVMLVYEKSDKNKDKYLTRGEFEVLVKAITRTALLRVASFKVVKIVGAPLLAEYLVRTLAGKEWLSKLATNLVPARFQEKFLPIICSRAFCRNVLLVLLVISLGHFVLGIVDMIFAMRAAVEQKKSHRY